MCLRRKEAFDDECFFAMQTHYITWSPKEKRMQDKFRLIISLKVLKINTKYLRSSKVLDLFVANPDRVQDDFMSNQHQRKCYTKNNHAWHFNILLNCYRVAPEAQTLGILYSVILEYILWGLLSLPR